jgi:hypothetical protein
MRRERGAQNFAGNGFAGALLKAIPADRLASAPGEPSNQKDRNSNHYSRDRRPALRLVSWRDPDGVLARPFTPTKLRLLYEFTAKHTDLRGLRYFEQAMRILIGCNETRELSLMFAFQKPGTGEERCLIRLG